MKYLIFALFALITTTLECKAELYHFDKYTINTNISHEVNEKVQVRVLDFKGLKKDILAEISFNLWDSKIKMWRSSDLTIKKKEKIKEGRYVYSGHLKKDSNIKATVYVDTTVKGRIGFTLVSAGVTLQVEGPVKKGWKNK